MISRFFRSKLAIAILLGTIFFFFQIFTIGDYNIMWDARTHFVRGQAFTNYYLGGKHNYSELEITDDYARYYRDYLKNRLTISNISDRISKDPSYRRSIYQDDMLDFDFFASQIAVGHPPLSDIGASIFNIIFYEKLGVVRDDHAYALFAIFLASVLIAVFFYWISKIYGFFSAFISTFVLASTPLFWAEAHNNIKDIPLLVFFSISIWFFWKGISAFSRKWVVLSAVFAGFAFSTKFNLVFLPFILGPWFILNFLGLDNAKRKKFLSWWWVLPLYPLIILTIFYVSWPSLWQGPVDGLINVVNYYKEVGVNIDYAPNFRTIFNISTYASLWILYTTYPVVIVLSLCGLIGWLSRMKKTKDLLPVLFLCWFLIPISRASLPNTSIFGGVRHIIEYIPALSFFAGYGVYFLMNIFSGRYKKLLGTLIILSFVPFIITLVKLHPVENVYFNSIIGGLNGAKKDQLTGWGNTDGGVYSVAIEWLNKNAEPNSHIATAFSEPADMFIPALRKDLLADNLFSGYLQKGEYIVALTHDSGLESIYTTRYSESFLKPLYVYSVDGVPLVKIWKNDKEHLKKEFSKTFFKQFNLMPQVKPGELLWDLGSPKRVMAVEINFDLDKCKKDDGGYLRVSNDQQNWKLMPDGYPGGSLRYLGDQPQGGKLIAAIPGEVVSYVSFLAVPEDSCILNVKNSKITIFE